MDEQAFKESVKQFLLKGGDAAEQKRILDYCENKYEPSFVENVYKKIITPERWLVAITSSYCVHLITD